MASVYFENGETDAVPMAQQWLHIPSVTKAIPRIQLSIPSRVGSILAVSSLGRQCGSWQLLGLNVQIAGHSLRTASAPPNPGCGKRDRL
jgi:hypothetical protein